MPAFILALFLTAGLAQSAAPITGIVLDPSGSAVPDAIVRLEVSGTPVHEMQTATDGRFAFPGDVGRPARVIVTAAGFAPRTVDVSGQDGELRITLEPAPFFEAVNVTSSRTDVPRADPTVTVTVISASELLTSGRRVARRRAEDGAGVHALPPHLVARVEPDRAGHLASRSWRHRREPVARARRTASR